jgi:hypothetical protein
VPTDSIGRVSTGNLDNAITPSGLAIAGLHLNASGIGYAPWPASIPNPDATPDTHVAHHTINQQNELQQLHSTRDGVSVTTTLAYDASGNLTDDGTYRYQYDAWGRLLSIHRRASTTTASAASLAPSLPIPTPPPSTPNTQAAPTASNASTTTASAASKKSSSTPSDRWAKPWWAQASVRLRPRKSPSSSASTAMSSAQTISTLTRALASTTKS